MIFSVSCVSVYSGSPSNFLNLNGSRSWYQAHRVFPRHAYSTLRLPIGLISRCERMVVWACTCWSIEQIAIFGNNQRHSANTRPTSLRLRGLGHVIQADLYFMPLNISRMDCPLGLHPSFSPKNERLILILTSPRLSTVHLSPHDVLTTRNGSIQHRLSASIIRWAWDQHVLAMWGSVSRTVFMLAILK